jgi:hypothetical protein
MWPLNGSPPARGAPPTPENVAALDAWLGSVIAFRARTHERPWTFYEQMEAYLGPWGAEAYPIGYGIKYCKIFYFEEALRSSSAGRAWVMRTLILLQLALKAFVLARFKAGSLAMLNAAEFKQAAFDSHAIAYTEAGLAMLVMLNPLLTRQILALAGAEFLPTRPNFVPTVKQFVLTSAITVPQCMLVFALNSRAVQRRIRTRQAAITPPP